MLPCNTPNRVANDLQYLRNCFLNSDGGSMTSLEQKRPFIPEVLYSVIYIYSDFRSRSSQFDNEPERPPYSLSPIGRCGEQISELASDAPASSPVNGWRAYHTSAPARDRGGRKFWLTLVLSCVGGGVLSRLIFLILMV